jgi:hypothetical protein
MSKYGNEMISELVNLLNKRDVGLDKTAAKKEPKEDKEEDADKKDKEEKKEKPKAKGKKKKKADLQSLLNNLVKLAEELDASGAEDAASLVDDALKVIVKNIKDEA